MNGYNSTSSGTNPDQHAAETAKGTEHPGRLPDRAPEEEPAAQRPREFGGRNRGLEPTRYGDWEKDGRCIDF